MKFKTWIVLVIIVALVLVALLSGQAASHATNPVTTALTILGGWIFFVALITGIVFIVILVAMFRKK